MPGRIPQNFIDDVLDRLDIIDVIGSRIELRKSGKNYSACCPFHDEKTPSFSVSPDSNSITVLDVELEEMLLVSYLILIKPHFQKLLKILQNVLG